MWIVHFKTHNSNKQNKTLNWAWIFSYDIILIKLRHLYPCEHRPNLINQCVHSEMRRSRGRHVCRSTCAGSTSVTSEREVVTPCVSRRPPDMMSSLGGRGSTRPRPNRQTEEAAASCSDLYGFYWAAAQQLVPAQLFKNTYFNRLWKWFVCHIYLKYIFI